MRLFQRTRRPLIITAFALALLVAFSLYLEITAYNNLRELGNQRVAVQGNINDILRYMLDQETGIRGYSDTQNRVFLEPYNEGRPNYQKSVQNLKIQLGVSNEFSSSQAALDEVNLKAEAWLLTFADRQIRLVEANKLAEAKGEATTGKVLFDALRASIANLNQVAKNDLEKIQSRLDTINLVVILATIIIALLPLLAIWLLYLRFSTYLGNQLDKMLVVVRQLQKGRLEARISETNDDEIGELAQSFNSMADALEKQQIDLKERDVLETISQLNLSTMNNLDLVGLADRFLNALLGRLELQLGAIYIYDPQTQTLRLLTSQGISRNQLQQIFGLGEGSVGLAGLNKQIYDLTSNSKEGEAFQIKTMLGTVLPATIYHAPLLRGQELLGVLSVASAYPMSENARNVLSLVVVNLAAAISNAQAYTRIQSQTAELEHGKLTLENTNREISRQRDELSVVNTALEEANRARGQFFSTMSHELRTPLTSIIGFAQILLRASQSSGFTSRQKENLERILKNGQHLLSMVNTVLDIAKIDAGRMDIDYDEVDLNEFLKSVVDQTSSLASQKNLALNLETQKDLPALKTDYEKLRQILLNLISNAIKFTETGSVTLWAGIDEAKSGYLALSVKDTGIGIDSASQAHIFDEFYQVDGTNTRKYGGTGLGLSITRKLIELLGGDLSIQSQIGQGAIFTVELPLQPDEPNAPPEARLYPSIGANAAETKVADNNSKEYIRTDAAKYLVVAVDDQPDILVLIEAALEGTPYEVATVNDSGQAMDFISRLKPYAVILDVMMPEPNGWQILQQIKSNPATASIPVIMLSVALERSVGYVLGASEFLVKPIDQTALVKTLSSLLPPSQLETGYILAVDDEPDIREMLRQTLSDAGFQVKTAEGGREALAKIEQTRPMLILLDLMMPDIDGFEVLHKLKAQPDTAAIPVVILTAKTLSDTDHKFLQRGADLVLQKGSLPLPEMAAKLRQVLAKLKN